MQNPNKITALLLGLSLSLLSAQEGPLKSFEKSFKKSPGEKFGSAWLSGEHTKSAFSFGIPVRWWPYEHFGTEVRPFWSTLDDTSVRDIEAALLLRYRQLSLRFGYRWLENGDGSLGGPLTGVSFRF